MEFNNENMIIQGRNFKVIDVCNDSITLPDCFAIQCNKYGKGHGEAKLYFGTKSEMKNFFGVHTECFVLKEDFVKYKNSIQSAKSVLSTIYKNAISGNTNFSKILKGIDSTINRMQDIESFNIKLMNGLKGSRGYINSINKATKGGYYYLRACCVPFASFIKVLKLQEISTGNFYFYIKLFPDFNEMYQQILHIQKYGTKSGLGQKSNRSGQTKYKRELVQLFHECPFLHIQDERLLVASHIQPFASCNNSQKYDIENGLLLSPLYDKLFDRGLITFDQQGQLKKTIWVSSAEWSKIPLNYSIKDLNLTPKRKVYMKFHEKYVFLG